LICWWGHHTSPGKHQQRRNTYKTGTYKIGIWVPDPSADLKFNATYAIKFANSNVEWWKDANDQYLINVIGEMEVY